MNQARAEAAQANAHALFEEVSSSLRLEDVKTNETRLNELKESVQRQLDELSGGGIANNMTHNADIEFRPSSFDFGVVFTVERLFGQLALNEEVTEPLSWSLPAAAEEKKIYGDIETSKQVEAVVVSCLKKKKVYVCLISLICFIPVLHVYF